MRTDETVFLYTQPCVSGRDRKTKPARWPVDPRARDIRVYKNRFQPPDCAPDIPPMPDILHGSYLVRDEQSPASSHNTPVPSHTRFAIVAGFPLYVKKNFGILAENFSVSLCRATKMVAFGLQWKGRGSKLDGAGAPIGTDPPPLRRLRPDLRRRDEHCSSASPRRPPASAGG